MCPKLRRGLFVGLVVWFVMLVPRPAFASGVVWVSLWTPSSFDPYTEIDLTVDASWPEYWPGDCASEETCAIQYADMFVSGDDEFSDSGEVDFDTSGEWWLSDSWAADRDVGYSAEVDVYWYDWYYDEWFSDYGTDYQTVSVSAPQISGPDSIWWFNGQTPSGYLTAGTLSSTGGAATEWVVDAGSEQISLSTSTGASTVVSSAGLNRAGSVGGQIP